MVDESPGVKKPQAGMSRRTVMKGAAWTVPALMVATAAPAYALSCFPSDTIFDAHGRGRFLSGQLINPNWLDTVVAVNGAYANVISGVAGQVSGPLGNPLSITALREVDLNLTGISWTLSDILGWATAEPPVGTVNQTAYAASSGATWGASGAVTNNGTIATGPTEPQWPEIASLQLSTIIKDLAGGVAAPLTGPLGQWLEDNVVDLQLRIGAIAGRASINEAECIDEDRINSLVRDYLVAWLRLHIQSELVGNLVGTTSTGLIGLLTGLAANTGFISDLLAAIADNALIDALANPELTLEVDIDDTSIATLLGQPFPSAPHKGLQVNMSTGEIILDLEYLAGGAYDAQGAGQLLNNAQSNTRLLVDAFLPTGGVAALLDDLIDELVDALLPLIGVKVTVSAVVLTSRVNIVSITDQADGFVTIEELLNGEGKVALLRMTGGGALATAVNLLVDLTLTPLLALASGPLLATLGGALRDGITGLLDPDSNVNSLLNGVNLLLQTVFWILQDLLVIRLNAQNDPQDGSTFPVPSVLSALPPRRYDVAALHIGLVQGSLLDLFLARGSVGPTVPHPQAASLQPF